MRYRHTTVTPKTFEESSESLQVRGWDVNYFSFCLPENRTKTPLVILGGAFQNFASFYQDVKTHLPDFPVIIIALPGQTGNQSNRDTDTLSFRDLAEILELTCEELGLETITLVGFSYGSIIAYQYAVYFEKRLEQLVLVGCSLELRHALREMFQHIVESEMDHDQNQFVEMMSQILLNFNTREQTGSTSGVLDRLTALIKRLTPQEISAYRANTSRLLKENLPRKSFLVRALIISAQHDHLIRPNESLEVFKLFDEAEFIVMQKSDHMLPLQSPKLIPETIAKFLRGQNIESPFVLTGLEALAQAQERRQLLRHTVNGLPATLSHPDGFTWQGFIEDINMDGCGLVIPEASHTASECTGTWKMTIQGTNYVIPGFLKIFYGKASFVFYKPDYQMRETLHELVGGVRETDDRNLAIH